ncbi:hypothetical protein [Falsibacillus pallidus]|uniref:Uncharacterized protein n=1 Tax=Falsibacillus pallidus TaxID=493781 RepID=A0A370GPB4_9BACI|nr:hypothetical protein [Falsibacillus pallidus]RDI45575.1 hypothetical protein DFR59_102203 [Falsibacillus pallidus]
MSKNVSMLNVEVVKEQHDFSERELKILDVLLLNLCANANMNVLKQGMAMNPIEQGSDHIFGVQLAWAQSITPEVNEEFKEAIDKRFKTGFKMCDIEGAQVSFVENAYLVK